MALTVFHIVDCYKQYAKIALLDTLELWFKNKFLDWGGAQNPKYRLQH